MDYRVYTIRNATGKRYIGLSSDVENRLRQHNEGESRYTKGKGPWTLEWTSVEMTFSDARKLESRMKMQKGGDGLQTLMNEYGS